MKYKDLMQELKSLGTEQNRKTYKRHGVQDELYGVSYARSLRVRTTSPTPDRQMISCSAQAMIQKSCVLSSKHHRNGGHRLRTLMLLAVKRLRDKSSVWSSQRS